MASRKKYWLLKCEPDAYSIDDLERDGRTGWEGVRNYQVRNYMRDEMKPGDEAIFYASNADPAGATGVARIASNAYPDPFQFRKGHHYEDPGSDPENPRWLTFDVEFVEKFAHLVTIDEMREQKALRDMMILRRGNRLSITPLTKQEFDTIRKVGRRTR